MSPLKHIWSILAISSIPIILFVQFFTAIDPVTVLTYQVPTLIALLIAQKLYYRHVNELCLRCSIQREFHNKSKYPQLTLVCDKFVKYREDKLR